MGNGQPQTIEARETTGSGLPRQPQADSQFSKLEQAEAQAANCAACRWRCRCPQPLGKSSFPSPAFRAQYMNRLKTQALLGKALNPSRSTVSAEESWMNPGPSWPETTIHRATDRLTKACVKHQGHKSPDVLSSTNIDHKMFKIIVVSSPLQQDKLGPHTQESASAG